MKVSVVGRQMNVYDDMRELIERKLEKLDKFFPEETEAVVTLSCKRNQKNMEVTISSHGTLFRSEVSDETFQNALDVNLTTIERQIRKNKTRLQKRFRSTGLDFPECDWESEGTEEFESDEKILRTKTFSLKPMSPEEAILQMNLLGHQFFVFNDDVDGKTCVVYRRNDGNYGLIVPENA